MWNDFFLTIYSTWVVTSLATPQTERNMIIYVTRCKRSRKLSFFRFIPNHNFWIQFLERPPKLPYCCFPQGNDYFASVNNSKKLAFISVFYFCIRCRCLSSRIKINRGFIFHTLHVFNTNGISLCFIIMEGGGGVVGEGDGCKVENCWVQSCETELSFLNLLHEKNRFPVHYSVLTKVKIHFLFT